MTESKALLLIFVAILVVTPVTCVLLAAMHASGTIWALATVLIIGVAADTSSRVGMHYAAIERRRQREASLLR